MGLMWLVTDLFLAGAPQAERRLGEFRATLADHDHLAIGYILAAMDVMLAIRAGRLAAAEELAGQCPGARDQSRRRPR